MDVLYLSFLSLTVTRTNATREPSGETCGSPIQTKSQRSFSVMFRFCAGRTAIAARKITNEVKNVRIGSIKDVAGSGFCLRSRLIVDLSYLEFGIPSIFGFRISSFAAAPSGRVTCAQSHYRRTASI